MEEASEHFDLASLNFSVGLISPAHPLCVGSGASLSSGLSPTSHLLLNSGIYPLNLVHHVPVPDRAKMDQAENPESLSDPWNLGAA